MWKSLRNPLSQRFALACATLALLGGLSDSGIIQSADAQTITLPSGRVSNQGYGWGYGTNRHRTRLTAQFSSAGHDLLLHAQGFDIENSNDVVIHLNGQRIGYVHPGRNRVHSVGALWLLPARLQRPGVNVVTFTRRAGDAHWGVRKLGLLRPGSNQSMFGYFRSINADRTHPNMVRVYFPDSSGEQEFGIQFYDVDTDGELTIRVAGSSASNVPTTSNNRFGPVRRYTLPARNAWVEIRNTVSNLAAANWGVRVWHTNRAYDDNAVAGFQPISIDEWDEPAVRRVLHTFAFGGHASEAQIKRWARMRPQAAIVQMLTFKQHNLQLSPAAAGDRDGLSNKYGSLQTLRGQMLRNPDLPASSRWLFAEDWAVGRAWTALTSARGLNPFLHRVAQWETNYHMAVNQNAGVSGRQILRFYDDITKTLERGLPYQYVMSTGATSAAIARQYKHHESRWYAEDNECECNEDFAREYYQLFFGILGEYNPEHHETVTIKNMSKILTDIQVHWSASLDGFPWVPTFGSRYHHRAALPLWPGYTSAGAPTARSRLVDISNAAINLPESQDNLPIKIIAGLADDRLDDAKINTIRTAWKSMGRKNMLDFLRAYAISTMFHDSSRVKYWNSLERRMFLNTGTRITNKELWFSAWIVNASEEEDYTVFQPKHNVFGAQRGPEAARSPETFRNAYNSASDGYWEYTRTSDTESGKRWDKAWWRTLPRDADGRHSVKHVAEYLWNRIIGDGLDNFGPSERAFVYALLGDDYDLLQLADANDINRVIYRSDVESGGPLRDLVNQLAVRNMPLLSSDYSQRNDAQHNIGRAVAFISATPYAFAQTGR